MDGRLGVVGYAGGGLGAFGGGGGSDWVLVGGDEGWDWTGVY